MENRSALDRMETSKFITIEERHREMNQRERFEKRRSKYSSQNKKEKKFFKGSFSRIKQINFDKFKNTKRYSFKGFKTQDPMVHSLLRNTAICAVAVLAVYGMKMIDTPITNSITTSVKQAISYEMNIDNTLGKLQFVNETVKGTQIIESAPQMVYPIEGTIKTKFTDTNSTGITFTCVKGATVCAAAEGTVAVVGEDSTLGKYVQIKHTDSIYSVCYGLTDITVKKGDKVTAKQKLGVSKATEMLFEVKINGRPVDPSQYFTNGNT